MSKRARSGLFLWCAATMGASSAFGSFHFMQIEQVIGGVNGDKTAQAIQLRIRLAGQNLMQFAQIRVWDAAGLNPILIVDSAAPVASGAAGRRVLIASTNFAAHTLPPAVPDFTMTNLIPASYMAAGSMTFEADGGSPIYWRLSWGGAAYTGSGSGDLTNDSNGNFNPPFGGSMPVSCTQSILFPGTPGASSTNNAADYILIPGAAVFVNNFTTSFVVQACAGAADCDDGLTCTTGDACVSGCCVFTPDNPTCANSDFCDGAEVCDAFVGCRSPGNPCVVPNPVCDEGTDSCGNCTGDPDCNDGVACTVDTCVSFNCVFTPNNANCPTNGNFCDGVEVCNAALGCVSPGDPCGPGTNCDEGSDTCPPVALSVRLEVVASGLESPVKLTHAGDGSGRLFIVEQTGLIRVVDGGVLLLAPFLDIQTELASLNLNPGYDERGLLGLAFHPDYALNGRFFVRYGRSRTSTGTEPCDLDTFIPGCHEEVLAEYHVDPLDSNQADPLDPGTILFTAAKPQWNHNAGDIAFGPDGFLYFTLGDGGGANDGLADVPVTHGPNGNGQNIDSPLGKMLRIDVDGAPPYINPPLNPFFGAVPGLDEIYAYGFRNPYRFSFDRDTGTLYLGDVGQDLFEEVDIVELGKNYGWVIREGLHCFDPLNPGNPPVSCPTTGAMSEPLIDPISEYPHIPSGLAVVGGYVYRGAVYPPMSGLYIYGDFSADFGPTGRLYYFDPTTTPPIAHAQLQLPGGAPLGKALKGFGEDEDGELYVCASSSVGPGSVVAGPGGGIVYRIAPPPPPTPVWDSTPTAATRASRTLTMTVPLASGASPDVAALRIEMVDLQHPIPHNRPANPTPNFNTFDTTLNGVCSGATTGPNFNGHHCDTDADCLGSDGGTPLDDGTCLGQVTCGVADGCVRWVGPVTTFREKQGVIGLGTYKAGRLQCTPYYRNWTTPGQFSVFGAEIIPSSTYRARTFGSDCDGEETTCTNVSPLVTMVTRRSGDVASPWNPPDTGDQPTGGDVGEVLNKFKGSPGSPSNIAALIFGNVPDPNTDVGGQEIGETVNSFKGLAYPFSGPCACPSTVTCGATACSSTNTAPCGAGLCVLTCVGGANDGLPCRDFPPNAPADHCPGGSCPTDGFCRDRCGRCN